MSALADVKAPSVCGAQGFGYQTHKEILQPLALTRKEFCSDASAGKSLAMWLYNCGIYDLAQAQAAFDRRPDWRHA